VADYQSSELEFPPAQRADALLVRRARPGVRAGEGRPWLSWAVHAAGGSTDQGCFLRAERLARIGTPDLLYVLVGHELENAREVDGPLPAAGWVNCAPGHCGSDAACPKPHGRALNGFRVTFLPARSAGRWRRLTATEGS
jgi:hypothetical protein